MRRELKVSIVCGVVAAAVLGLLVYANAGGYGAESEITFNTPTAISSASADAKATATGIGTGIGYGGDAKASTGPVTQTVPVSQTANPSQKTDTTIKIVDNSVNAGYYPYPFSTPTPYMQSPNVVKAWQLAITIWEDGKVWPYSNVNDGISDKIEIHGGCAAQSKGTATGLQTFHAAPANAYRVCSWSFVAKDPSVDVTMLEKAAMAQAKKDKASGIIELQRYFFAKNNTKGGGASLGMAMSILGSLAGNITQYGPTGGFQYGKYVADQDVYVWLAVDTIDYK